MSPSTWENIFLNEWWSISWVSLSKWLKGYCCASFYIGGSFLLLVPSTLWCAFGPNANNGMTWWGSYHSLPIFYTRQNWDTEPFSDLAEVLATARDMFPCLPDPKFFYSNMVDTYYLPIIHSPFLLTKREQQSAQLLVLTASYFPAAGCGHVDLYWPCEVFEKTV